MRRARHALKGCGHFPLSIDFKAFMNLHRVACGLLVAAILGCSPGIRAEDTETRFEIRRFKVEGNTLLSAAEIEQRVSPFVGPGRTYGDVQRALEALEATYRGRGFGTVQVNVPEQELTQGIVTLQVTEAVIGKVTIQGNQQFSQANVRAAMPHLQEDKAPNMLQLSENVQLANENPAKQVQLVLGVSDKEGQVDARLEITEDDPQRIYLTLDDTGNQASGRHRIGVVLGTSTSGIEASERAVAHRLSQGAFPPEFHYRQQEIGRLAPFLAEVLGLTGPALTVSTACTSSGKALVTARNLLRLGLCDAVITGGSDSLCKLTLNGFASLESVTATLCNPLSRNRCGINVGEAAVLFLLRREPAEVALLGAGASSDAHHISSPEPSGRGAEAAMRAALAEAGLPPEGIGYLNLHATATPKNDEMESLATARVFPDGVPCSGTKPLTGHTLGARAATAPPPLGW